MTAHDSSVAVAMLPSHAPIGLTTRSKIAFVCALALLAAAQIFAFFPGYLTHDSAYQWWQARTGELTTLWPPGMILLMAAVDAWIPGPTVLYVGHSCIYWAVAAFFTLNVRNLRLSLLTFLLFALFPTAAICLPHVWIDVELATLLMLVAALVTYANGVTARRAKIALVLAAFIVVFAALVRHNAWMALPPLCWAIAYVWPDSVASTQRRNPRVIAVAAGLLLAVAVAAYATLPKALSRTHADTWAITLIWDLQALSVASHAVLVPKLISEDATLDDLTQSFDSVNAVTMYVLGKSKWVNATTGLTEPQASALRSAWTNAVLAHPLQYLAHRAHVALKMVGPKRNPQIDGGADEPIRLVFKDNPVIVFANPEAMAWARKWIDWLKPHWLATPMVWMSASTLILAIRLRQNRHSPMTKIALAVWLSGGMYLLPLFLISPTADVRYVFWPTLAMLLAALIAGSKATASAQWRLADR